MLNSIQSISKAVHAVFSLRFQLLVAVHSIRPRDQVAQTELLGRTLKQSIIHWNKLSLILYSLSQDCKKLTISCTATEGKTIVCLARPVRRPNTHRFTCNQVSAHSLVPEVPPSNEWAILDKPNS
jgi:hypothetical protein